MREKLRISVLGLLLLSLAACGGSAKKTLAIGAILPLTGPAASAGDEAYKSLMLAVEEANASQRLAPYTLEVVVRDDVSDPKQAVSSAKDLASNPAVLGVIAHFNSGCYMPASRVYHENGLPAITPAASNPSITQQGFPEIHRIVPTDQVQGEAVGKFIAKRGVKRLAIIHDKTQYGEPLAGMVRASAEQSGVKVISYDGIQVGDKDFRALLTSLRSKNPEAVFFGGLYDEGGLIVKQMRELGMTQTFHGPDGIKGKDFIDVAGAAANGAYVSFIGNNADALPSARSLLENYQKRFNKPIENFGPYAYDVAGVFIAVLENLVKRGETPTRAAVLAELGKIRYEGAMGFAEFDERGDNKNRAISFYRVDNGQFVFVEAIGESSS
ncbi:MAG: hypothetical protein A3G34_10890 [Candidatus Lindowbacteria bacterium RIFCSPLOWO2_12_FULL_62_27]|nr:MAG: hypothetical protein A3G34_10890 [Candidatus Lindowbacteria bacterium RIFCSPLOWO2_12_FULL_62_27]